MSLLLRILSSKMADALKNGAEARKHSLAIGGLEYSGDLVQKLMAFSSKMETVYRCLQELKHQKQSDQSLYQKHFNIIDEKLIWYTQAEAVLVQPVVRAVVLTSTLKT